MTDGGANGKAALPRRDIPRAALDMQKRDAWKRDAAKKESLKRAAPVENGAKRPKVASSNFLMDLYAGLPPPDPQKDAAAKERVLAKQDDDKDKRLPHIDRSKVVFLDVDGVLRPMKAGGYAQYNFGDGEAAITCDTSDFIQAAMDNLRTIILETGAVIVLSSEWRRSPVMREGLDDALRANNLHTCIGHTTTFLERELGSGDPLTAFKKRRCKEIDDWLDKNPHIEQWVAIDDMDLTVGDAGRPTRLPKIVEHFVQTNDQVGITARGAQAAIRILKGEKIPPQVLKVQPQRELLG